MEDDDTSRDKWWCILSFSVPAGLSSVHLQPVHAAHGNWEKGLAMPFSWQTVFSWSCRVPVSVGEDLAPCHSLSWYMGILPSFLSVFPSLDITCVGGGEAKGENLREMWEVSGIIWKYEVFSKINPSCQEGGGLLDHSLNYTRILFLCRE